MPLSTLAESGASMSYGHIFPCSFTNEEIKIKFDVDDFIFDFIEDFSLLLAVVSRCLQATNLCSLFAVKFHLLSAETTVKTFR